MKTSKLLAKSSLADIDHIIRPATAGLIYFGLSIALSLLISGGGSITAMPTILTIPLFFAVFFVLIRDKLKNDELSKRDYFIDSEKNIRYMLLTYLVLYTFQTFLTEAFISLSFYVSLIVLVVYFYLGGLVFSFVLYWVKHNILSEE